MENPQIKSTIDTFKNQPSKIGMIQITDRVLKEFTLIPLKKPPSNNAGWLCGKYCSN